MMILILQICGATLLLLLLRYMSSVVINDPCCLKVSEHDYFRLTLLSMASQDFLFLLELHGLLLGSRL